MISFFIDAFVCARQHIVSGNHDTQALHYIARVSCCAFTGADGGSRRTSCRRIHHRGGGMMSEIHDDADGVDRAEWWTFWGGPACGESQQRVAAAFAPVDPDASPPEHLRIMTQHDAARRETTLRVHRYEVAPWPPRACVAPYWRYTGSADER
jgi:hypothetical protein